MEAEYSELFLSNYQPAHLPWEPVGLNCKGVLELGRRPRDAADRAPLVRSPASDALRITVTAFGTPAHHPPSVLDDVPVTPKTPKEDLPVQCYEGSCERLEKVAVRNVVPSTAGPIFEFHRGVFPMEPKHGPLPKRQPSGPASVPSIEARHQRLVAALAEDVEEDRRVWDEVKQPGMHEAPSPPPEPNAPADAAAGPDVGAFSAASWRTCSGHKSSAGAANADRQPRGMPTGQPYANLNIRFDSFLEQEHWMESVSDAMYSCTSCSTVHGVNALVPALLHFTVQVPPGTVGLQYRRSKSLYDMLPRMVRSGAVVSGIVESSNDGTWLSVEDGVYLPMMIGNMQVLRPISSRSCDILTECSGCSLTVPHKCLAKRAVNVVPLQKASDDLYRDGPRVTSLDLSARRPVAIVPTGATPLPVSGVTGSSTDGEAKGGLNKVEQLELEAVVSQEAEDELPEPRSELAKPRPLSLQRPLQRASSQTTRLAAVPLLSVNKRVRLPLKTDSVSRSTGPVFLGAEGLLTEQPIPAT